MEVLVEIGMSKEVLKATKETLEASIKSRLPSGSSSGPYLLPYDSEKVMGTYILQKWSSRWQTFVNSDKEIAEGDRFRVVEHDYAFSMGFEYC